MQSDHAIEKTVRIAAGNFHYMLKLFFPSRGVQFPNCDINEANISLQFVHAWLSWRPEAGGYLEVPFVFYSSTPPRRNQYDFFLHGGPVGHDGSVAIVGETKMISSPHYSLGAVRRDIVKQSDLNVQEMLRVCAEDRPVHDKVFDYF